MPKITKIFNPAFKSGISAKTNKPWTLMTIEVDGNTNATMFAPGAEGDEVELKYDEQYKNYSATKVTQQSKERNEMVEKLDKILKYQSSILELLTPKSNSKVYGPQQEDFEPPMQEPF